MSSLAAPGVIGMGFSAALSRVVDAGFVALLVVCGARYFSVHEFDTRGAVVLALAVCSGLAYVVAVVAVPSELRRRIGILTATGLWFPLVLIAPSFGWAAFALFFAVHRVLPRRIAQMIAAAIVVAVSCGLFLMSRGDDLGLVLGPLVGGIVLFIVYAQLNRVLEQREQLITELLEAQTLLAQREREAGALTERTRVATELHDTVVQQVASALLLIESVNTSDGAAQPEPVVEAREVLRHALVETRQLMYGLAARPRETQTFTDELRGIAELHGATFSVVGDMRQLSPEVEHALSRVTREALVNVEKHAQASQVQVTLTLFDDAVAIDVADNGVGFMAAPPEPAAVGYGLRAMAWRIENLGGSFTVESAPSNGTVISGHIPDQPALGARS